MGNITNSKQVRKREFPDVTIYTLGKPAQAGTPQEVLVEIAPHGAVPLHAHRTDAKMIIVAGSGIVLSADQSMHGTPVGRGDSVFFEAEVPHGFQAFGAGLTFLSQNGGIVDERESEWDVSFT